MIALACLGLLAGPLLVWMGAAKLRPGLQTVRILRTGALAAAVITSLERRMVDEDFMGMPGIISTRRVEYTVARLAFSTVTGRQVEFSHYFPAADGVLPQDRFDVRYLPQNPWQYRLAGEGDGGELAVAVLWSLVGLEMIAMAIYVLVAGPV